MAWAAGGVLASNGSKKTQPLLSQMGWHLHCGRVPFFLACQYTQKQRPWALIWSIQRSKGGEASMVLKVGMATVLTGGSRSTRNMGIRSSYMATPTLSDRWDACWGLMGMGKSRSMISKPESKYVDPPFSPPRLPPVICLPSSLYPHTHNTRGPWPPVLLPGGDVAPWCSVAVTWASRETGRPYESILDVETFDLGALPAKKNRDLKLLLDRGVGAGHEALRGDGWSSGAPASPFAGAQRGILPSNGPCHDEPIGRAVSRAIGTSPTEQPPPAPVRAGASN